MPDTATPDQTAQLSISDSAARRIGVLKEMEGNPDMRLRIAVSGGGCSGFQYGFSLDDQTGDDDVIFDHNGIQVVVDTVSLDLLQGSELDFVEDLMGAYFSMRNPNATSTCGCGSSFAI